MSAMSHSTFNEKIYTAGLVTREMGRSLTALDTAESTNSAARALARDGAQSGAAVIAAEQTAGRGRFGRAWVSPRGGLWFSLLLRVKTGDPVLPALPVLAGTALLVVLEEISGRTLTLGWPNDIVFEGKKLAGMLVESEIGGGEAAVVIGAGVNVNNQAPELKGEQDAAAVSLREITGEETPLEKLLAEFMNTFELALDDCRRDGADRIFEQWKQRLELVGKKIVLKSDEKILAGVVKDFSADGSMSLKLEDGSTATVPLDRGTLMSSKYTKHL